MKAMMNKRSVFFFLLFAVFSGLTTYAQRFDTTGCSQYVHFRYDKFTEEKEVVGYDPVVLLNAEGSSKSPLSAGTYKVSFLNALSGRQLDKFESRLIISEVLSTNGEMKEQINTPVTVYFIFDGNKKFNIKANIENSGTAYKIELPLQGDLLLHYKTKKMEAMRITGNHIANIDFELDTRQSNHLLNELSCMFGLK